MHRRHILRQNLIRLASSLKSKLRPRRDLCLQRLRLIPEPTPASTLRSPFGFFGRRKAAAPAPAPRANVQARPAPSGDLFGNEKEDELEIPSFLRRQNR